MQYLEWLSPLRPDVCPAMCTCRNAYYSNTQVMTCTVYVNILFKATCTYPSEGNSITISHINLNPYPSMEVTLVITYPDFEAIFYSLKWCYKWPPYIFAPVQTMKIALTNFLFYEKNPRLCRDSANYLISK